MTKKPDHAARLAALRAELTRRKLDGFFVPIADEHQNSYVHDSAKRLAWLTGFTGSHGLLIVLPDQAALFVSGIYELQARKQTDSKLVSTHHMVQTPWTDWIKKNLPAKARLGFDPWLHTDAWAKRAQEMVQAACGKIVPVAHNPVDRIWTDRPAPPCAPIVAHPRRYTGRLSADKRHEIAAELKKNGQDAAVLVDPSSIAWLLNLRGGDTPDTPLPFSFAVLHSDSRLDWYVDPRKIEKLDKAELHGVRLHPPSDFIEAMAKLKGRAVRLDSAATVRAIVSALDKAGAKTVMAADPVALPRAIKNAAEQRGFRDAHRRDGVALVTFFAWLDAQTRKREVTEIEASDMVESLRRADPMCRSLSFPSISGAGEHGAIIHYRATEATNASLRSGDLYLLDSGGQYLGGTTDVTRTVAIGQPSPQMRRAYTRVLQGHLALAMARFPEGTVGSQLDPLARVALWREGWDYDHGTGHGVGAYLGVHEGPHMICPNRSGREDVPLRPGMVISNEPGVYIEKAFGIRIESLVLVRKDGVGLGKKPYFSLETLTLAPFDPALIDISLLSGEERAWIDVYHARVRAEIGPRVSPAARRWLNRVTRPLRLKKQKA